MDTEKCEKQVDDSWQDLLEQEFLSRHDREND